MAQIPCEASLRPDWLAVSFKSSTERDRDYVWGIAQECAHRVTGDIDFKEGLGSRHFETKLAHDIGITFESSSLTSSFNAGLSVINFSGKYWALSSVYEQLRMISRIHSFKGRYHYTRLDAQVTTLNPSQSAEQIVNDVQENKLWIKGYKGWEPKGLKDRFGEPLGSLSACFGAATSDRRATSYNKAVEQGWETPARRDETRLRGDWAEAHMTSLATSVLGASSENVAIEALQTETSTALVQHMQYLSLDGKSAIRSKDWARTAKAPAWWTETLEQDIEPVKVNRKPQNTCWVSLGHMTAQYKRCILECAVDLVKTGRSANLEQALFDIGRIAISRFSDDDIEAAIEPLIPEIRQLFRDQVVEARNRAAEHLEFV